MRKIGIIILFAISIFLCSCGKDNKDIKPSDNQESALPDEETSFIFKEEDSHYISKIMQSEDESLWRNRSIQYPQDVKEINTKVLCSTIWQYNPTRKTDYVLIFYLDGEFRIGSETGIDLSGKYSVLPNNQVELYDISSRIGFQESYLSIVEEKVVLTFQKDINNYFYTDILTAKNTNQYFGATGSESPADKIYDVNGNETYKESWKAITTERVKFRVGPATDKEAKIVDYSGILENDPQIDYFMKSINLEVLGRTKDKVLINDIEDYWYYVRYTSEKKVDTGWVFGGYITQYDPSKQEEYKKILADELVIFSAK